MEPTREETMPILAGDEAAWRLGSRVWVTKKGPKVLTAKVRAKMSGLLVDRESMSEPAAMPGGWG